MVLLDILPGNIIQYEEEIDINVPCFVYHLFHDHLHLPGDPLSYLTLGMIKWAISEIRK